MRECFAFWAAEAAWRTRQQRLRRQSEAFVNYATRAEPLGGKLDSGQWARKVLGIDARMEQAWSDQNLRALRHAAARARQPVKAA